MTWPLALILPATCEGLAPCTVFSVIDWVFGCSNVTDCCEPTLKLCQLIAPRWVDCVIVVALAVWLIEAAPPTTTPPIGCAFGAGCAAAGTASTITATACKAVLTSKAERVRLTRPTRRTGSVRVLKRRELAIKFGYLGLMFIKINLRWPGDHPAAPVSLSETSDQTPVKSNPINVRCLRWWLCA